MSRQSLLAATFICVFNTHANAAEVSFSLQSRQVTPEEVADTNGPPDGHLVHDFFLTTNADILRIGDVFIEGSGLYNNSIGSNTAPPNPAFITVFPSLAADSWITTPGLVTATAGGDLGEPNVSWFDVTDDGPQQNFHFARLTVAGPCPTFVFRGVVSVSAANGPEIVPFSIIVFCPEPTSMALLGLGMLATLGVRRRHETPR
ncbi:MAG: PEP-CTERM sorting domain-containing protein [Lacipirellulaceae bacterium]